MCCTLTTQTLISISGDILHGRPLWGMLRLNEYLGSADPLHRAYRDKARQALAATPGYGAAGEVLAQRVLSGLRLGDLPHRDQQQLRALIASCEPIQLTAQRKIPRFSAARSLRARLAVAG